MRAPAVLLPALLILSAACVGPPAPDVELCRDVVSRLCAARGCPDVGRELGVEGQDVEACSATLIARVGCTEASFRFSEGSVPREDFLLCRERLLRTNPSDPSPIGVSNDPAQVACTDAADFLACGSSGALFRAAVP